MNSEDKLADFLWKVYEGEGLGYSLSDYYTSDISKEVDDPKLIELWAKASIAVRELNEYMQLKFEELDME